MSNSFLTSAFAYKAWANQSLLDVLEAVPLDRNPIDIARIRITLDHTSVVDQIFMARIMGKPEPFRGVISPKTPSFGELREIMRATDAWYLDYARVVTDANLDEAIDFVFVDDGKKGRMTRGEMLGHVLTHANSHRGVIGKMLDDLGIAGPADMLTTFLHDKP
jgi:uncharacterized damage-inducible protein DinB